MAVPVIKFPILMRLIRLMGVLVTALVLTWTVHYRGGLALVSANKDLIFNVRTPTLPLIDAVISKSRLGWLLELVQFLCPICRHTLF